MAADALLDGLFSPQHTPLALIEALVRTGDGLLVQLDGKSRQDIAKAVTESLTNRMRLRVATPERMRTAIVERRPDLRVLLETSQGLAWIGRELVELRSLAEAVTR